MYFGSVRFFKHLIYTVFFLLIGTLIFLAVFFGIMFFQERSDVRELTEELAEFDDNLNIPPQTPLSDVYSDLESNGFNASAMLSAIAIEDTDGFEDFLRRYIEANPSAADKLSPDGDNNNGDSTEGGNSTEGTVTEDETDETADDTPPPEPPKPDVPAYQQLYPELYTTPPTEFTLTPGTAYLTFDDGPSEYTASILQILKKHDVKATFFLSGGDSDTDKRTMKAIAEDGHTLGVHSLSHNYTQVYASVESFLEDFYNTYNSVYEATGIKPAIFRFPGGSVNNYNRFIYKEIIAEMTRRGFVYYDWNVSGEDAADGATWTSIYNYVLDGAKLHRDDRAIILLHDSKSRTVTVVEDLITALDSLGFTFAEITHDVMPVTFAYVS